MMYKYMTLGEDIKISHSGIMEDNDEKRIIVQFERGPIKGGDIARSILPSYLWTKNEGFSYIEISLLEKFLHNNVHLIFRYAGSGGVDVV